MSSELHLLSLFNPVAEIQRKNVQTHTGTSIVQIHMLLHKHKRNMQFRCVPVFLIQLDSLECKPQMRPGNNFIYYYLICVCVSVFV